MMFTNQVEQLQSDLQQKKQCVDVLTGSTRSMVQEQNQLKTRIQNLETELKEQKRMREIVQQNSSQKAKQLTQRIDELEQQLGGTATTPLDECSPPVQVISGTNKTLLTNDRANMVEKKISEKLNEPKETFKKYLDLHHLQPDYAIMLNLLIEKIYQTKEMLEDQTKRVNVMERLLCAHGFKKSKQLHTTCVLCQYQCLFGETGPSMLAFRTHQPVFRLCYKIATWLLHISHMFFVAPGHEQMVYELVLQMVKSGSYTSTANMKLLQVVMNIERNNRWQQLLRRLMNMSKEKKHEMFDSLSKPEIKIRMLMEFMMVAREKLRLGCDGNLYTHEDDPKTFFRSRGITIDLRGTGFAKSFKSFCAKVANTYKQKNPFLSILSTCMYKPRTRECALKISKAAMVVASYEWDMYPQSLNQIVEDIVAVVRPTRRYPNDVLDQLLLSCQELVAQIMRYR